MKRSARTRGRHTRGPSAIPPPPAPAPSARHPAFVIAALIAAGCIASLVSFLLYDTDMWQHLAVGRAIWTLHAIPTRQFWTWPTYGAPDVNASWGFRALIWPLWNAFGVRGLFAWRWVSTLAVFTLLLLAARRMGAAGFAPLFAMVLCALTYRHRSQIRPETLVSVLLAAQILIHETWRARERWFAAGGGGAAGAAPPDPRPWLVLIAWVWANAHISYWIGFAVQGFYLVAAPPARGALSAGWLERAGLHGVRAPIAFLAASLAVSLVNPWGWQALWQPFAYFLYWRHEAVFQSIGELAPLDWSFNLPNLLPLMLAGWAALLIWRARARGSDRVEILMFLTFVPLAIGSQRFTGFLSVAAAPFLARDLDSFVRAAKRGSAPAAIWLEGAIVALACVGVCVPEWRRISTPMGIGIDWRIPPARACDFIVDHDIHGRVFNQFAAGGYMVYRFWPDRSRLPFMDIHQAGTLEDRYYYAWAQQDSSAWRFLDTKYHFDDVLLFTRQSADDSLIDWIGADTTRWALVESDDAASLFLRRDGRDASLAERWRYRVLPAGHAAWYPRLAAAIADAAKRHTLEAEFARAADSSPVNSRALTGLALLADADGREAEARALLNRAIRANPKEADVHRYLAELDLAGGDARGALSNLARERALSGESAELDAEVGRAWQRSGNAARARESYERALRLDPSQGAPRDSLARLGGGP